MPREQRRVREGRINIPIASIETPKKTGEFLTRTAKESLKEYKEKHVIFSWQFFDRDHPLFNCGGVGPDWFLDLMDTMRSVSQMEFEKFKLHKGPPLRVHPHEWDRVSAKYPLNEKFLEQIEQDTLQFSVSKANGRIHGFVIENIFYIVWMDPHHNLYPMERHGGLTYCDNPINCYDCLLIENEELRKENEALYEELGKALSS